MKKLTYMFLTIFAITAVSCSKNNDNTTSSSNFNRCTEDHCGFKFVEGNIFTERGVDQTSSLSSFEFQFNTDGTLIVTGSGSTFSGSWSVLLDSHTKPDDSGNHSGTEDHKMVLQITGNSNMDEISEDWHIVSITQTEMRFIDDNPASAKEIRFSK